VVARLGGDEFGIMFPETTQENAKVVLNKIKDNILAAMQKNKWPVTCSIGAVTFLQVPDNVQEAIKLADNLMYTVKKSGKNAIAQESWPDS
jgi:diguanylate cyclase (GGDEF)-like protein